MAGIDYTIPGQFKGIQLESPMNAMAQAMQLRNLQETSQMNALKTQEYQRAREEENALRKLFASGLSPDSPEFRNMLYSKAPGLAPTIEKNILERGKAAAEIEYKQAQGRKEAGEALEKNLVPFRSNAAAVTTPEQAEAHTKAIYAHPVLGPWANKVMSLDQAVAQSRDLFTKDPQRWILAQTGVSGDKIVEITQKQEELRRKENDAAYADYVYQTKMANPDAVVVSKANFLAQRNQPANAAVTPTPVNATATNVTPNAQMPTAAVATDGTNQLPAVTVTADNSIDPVAAELYRTGDPKYKPIADALQAAHIERIKRGQLTGEFANVDLARQKIFELSKNPTPENLVKINDLKEMIKAAQKGKGTNVNVGVKLPPQEKAFEEEIGKGQAKKLLENKEKAEDARDMLDTVSIGRGILKSGAITGAGADFFVGLNQALKTAGVDFGYADASANSQAYTANMAQNVGKLIKLFGAGTGLSNADRDYAEKMAGGKIALDKAALEKILDIQERAARNVIKRHNKNVEGVKTNIPLTVDVEEPSAAKPIPKTNDKGWKLHTDKNGKQAYVSPDGKKYEEVK